MTDQFKADWGLANNTDTAIITFQIPLSTGVKILDSLLPKIEMDIKILDEKKYGEIKNKIEEISKEFNDEAEKIKATYEQKSTSNDPYKDEGLNNDLNNLKHNKQQEILVSIQNMGYRSGWLD
jgi:hypothetical protein